uniref:Uncharacterized protein n=1 Tax=Anguilla anguilla TaxID=7936 RepID=A0A0E9VKM0_ANGAN
MSLFRPHCSPQWLCRESSAVIISTVNSHTC